MSPLTSRLPVIFATLLVLVLQALLLRALGSSPTEFGAKSVRGAVFRALYWVAGPALVSMVFYAMGTEEDALGTATILTTMFVVILWGGLRHVSQNRLPEG